MNFSFENIIEVYPIHQHFINLIDFSHQLTSQFHNELYFSMGTMTILCCIHKTVTNEMYLFVKKGMDSVDRDQNSLFAETINFRTLTLNSLFYFFTDCIRYLFIHMVIIPVATISLRLLQFKFW